MELREACGGFSEPAAQAFARVAGTGRGVVEKNNDPADLKERAAAWRVEGQPVCTVRLVGGPRADTEVVFDVAQAERAPQHIERISSHSIGLGAYTSAGETRLWFRCGDLGVVRARMLVAHNKPEDDPQDQIRVLQDLVHRAATAWGCADEAKVPAPAAS